MSLLWRDVMGAEFCMLIEMSRKSDRSVGNDAEDFESRMEGLEKREETV